MKPHEYLEWVAKKVAPMLDDTVKRINRYRWCNDRPQIIESLPAKTKHFIVPVLAIYDESVSDREFETWITVNGEKAWGIKKPKGQSMTPLVALNDAIVIEPKKTIDVEPRPEKLIVFEIVCE